MNKTPPELPFNDEWKHPDYEWPVCERPDPGAIQLISDAVVEDGGRALREPHADRYVTMQQPSADGEKMVNRRVSRCECRRKAQVSVPTRAGDPVTVCIICDNVNRWPLTRGEGV
jgi:hypothetical protein